jgi:hypothetical protein
MANLPQQLVNDGLLDPETVEYPDLAPYCLGIVERIGQPPILCYDKHAVLEYLERDGMTPDEADEWFDTNILGTWVNDTTPCFLTRLEAP